MQLDKSQLISEYASVRGLSYGDTALYGPFSTQP